MYLPIKLQRKMININSGGQLIFIFVDGYLWNNQPKKNFNNHNIYDHKNTLSAILPLYAFFCVSEISARSVLTCWESCGWDQHILLSINCSRCLILGSPDRCKQQRHLVSSWEVVCWMVGIVTTRPVVLFSSFCGAHFFNKLT